MRALVVDDSRAARYLVRKTLHLLGFNEIAMADSAATATGFLNMEPSFDLMLCDHYMPDTNGTDLINTIREDARHADLPIIMMSADHAAGQIDNALHSGADEYLIKPFTAEDLRAKLELIGIPSAQPAA